MSTVRTTPAPLVPVNVEVCLRPDSTLPPSHLTDLVETLIRKSQFSFYGDRDITEDILQRYDTEIAAHLNRGEQDMEEGQQLIEENELISLKDHLQHVRVVDLERSSGFNRAPLELQHVDLRVHAFQLNDEGAAEEMADDSDDVPACKQWILPSVEFDGLWESLIYEDDLQFRLLDYAATMMLFSDRMVNSKLVSWNRVILLHGPPGTGKTSLCKALAQKLSIRLSHRYSYGQLIEINAHSLFSKWFSESGKLVMKLFQRIHEMVEDEESLVCVLIDEVESLTAARKAALNGSEPSDSIRVVNAVLTQLDQLKNCDNVLILTTSNITQAIDIAFVDRADVKQYVGPPSVRGRYSILRSCIHELVRVGIVTPTHDSSQQQQQQQQQHHHQEDRDSLIPDWTDQEAVTNPNAQHLKRISEICEGLSGRALRKLPFLAHAFFVKAPQCSLQTFLAALEQAVAWESEVRERLDDDKEQNV